MNMNASNDTNPGAPPAAATAGNKRASLLGALMLVAGLVGGVWYFFFLRNPLPNDEEIIARFTTHRSEIEELVKRYREFQRPPDKSHSLWEAPAEVQALKKAAGVDRVDYVGAVWMPDPYSIATAKRIDTLVRMKERDFDLFPRYGTIQVSLGPKDRYWRNTAPYSIIWKTLLFYPEVPRIENGVLWNPPDVNGEYKTSSRDRVLPLLNGYPPAWEKGECVLRRIEPQWFIDMCRST